MEPITEVMLIRLGGGANGVVTTNVQRRPGMHTAAPASPMGLLGHGDLVRPNFRQADLVSAAPT